MGKLTKLLIFPFLFLLISTASASSTWTLTGCSEIKQCSIPCGPQTVSIIDFNDDTILINIIESDSIIETIFLSSGGTEYFNNDLSKVVSYKTNDGSSKIAVYKKNLPSFSVSPESKQFTGYVTTDIAIKCLDQPAKNVIIALDSENTEFIKDFDKIKYKSVETDKVIEKQIKFKSNANTELILKIEYEDVDGNYYSKEFDILKNVVINDYVKPSEVKTGYTIIRKTREEIEQRIFYNAITRALQHIDFSDSAEAELRTIQKQLEQ